LQRGEKPTDQYAPKEAEKLFEEVPEDAYKRIVASRRDDFVVGESDLGYTDNGKEIWEGENAVKELKMQVRESENIAAELKSGAAEPVEVMTVKENNRDKLMQAFKAFNGPGSASGESPPKRPDVDKITPPKRKREDGDGADEPFDKKPAPAVVVKQEPGESATSVRVKKEPDELASSVKVVKREAAGVKKEASIKRELVETISEVSSSAQLREWLQGGACEGVKVDAEAKAPAQGSKLQREEDGSLFFFFVDAFEDDRANPPRVYLFGKVRAGQGYQSCCLVVENIERSLNLLLNVPDLEDESAILEATMNAEAEFDAICREHCPGIKKLRTKLKWRNYAFEKPVAQGAGYLPFLKVLCDTSSQMPPPGLSGNHFSDMFGAQTSLLERLLLTRRIAGPSWLRLQPDSWTEELARLSFCPLELRIKPASIFAPKTEGDRQLLSGMNMPTASPPLRILSLSMQTWQRSAQQPHEAVAIACTLHPNVGTDASDSDMELRNGMSTWAAVRRLDTVPATRDAEHVLPRNGVEYHNTEMALIQAFLAKVQEFDADVIVGHNAYGFDLDVLAARMWSLRVQLWQKLGRLRRHKERMPHVEGRQGAGFWVGTSITAGRLVCDISLQAKDLVPKLGTYDLATLARNQLGVNNLRVVEPESLPGFYDSAKSLVEMAELTFHSALCNARIMHSLQILPLNKQLTNLAGNLWNSSLQNKRAERNELLLCHEFHKKKFVLPDRESFAARKRRQQLEGGGNAGADLDNAEGPEQQGAAAAGPRRGKAQYTGGLVLEPKVGLYDDFVMLLDFNSLYPSIIQEHNICFTTVERPNEVEVAKCPNEAELLARTQEPEGSSEEGVLPQVLRRLVESRRTVKMAMKSERDPRRLQMLEIRQKAIKLTANSMYGCLGFQHSRFYAKPLAALITAKGRHALQTVITIVQQELQLDVVYGDTDSVFVNTKTTEYDPAMQIAQQIKRSVNKRYKKLEIEIDAIFARLMLLKKKKYAALKVVDWEKRIFERELKGLDIVRRDWCGLAKDMGEQILMRVLSGEGKEEAVNWIHSFLTEKGQEINDQKVPLERYVITKGLTKDPKDYPDARNLPHVQVALRLIGRGRAVRPGQEVEYVICEAEGAKASMAERARHPHEFQLDPTLRVDIDWYKKQQVHPLVSRLLGPVEGTDAVRIAECLGMDSARFAQAAASKAGAGGEEQDMAWVEAAVADVNALFDRKVRWKDFESSLPGVQCVKCQKDVKWKQMLQPTVWEANGVNALFRCGECSWQVHPKQAQNVFVVQLRNLLKEHCEGWVKCHDVGVERTRRFNRGQNMVNERVVMRELEYMEHLCEGVSGYPGEDGRSCRDAAKGMARTLQWLLECNSNNWVNCGQLFGGIFSTS